MHKSHNLLKYLVILAAATPMAGACGGSDSGGGDGPDADMGDITPPMIVQTDPADGAMAVDESAKIEITFSEGMDPATVEAAYTSTDLPKTAIVFSWNATADVLTITPVGPLDYATGTGTEPNDVAAKVYNIEIGPGAKDFAGNGVSNPLKLGFATKRRMTATVALTGALTRTALGTTLQGAGNDYWAGDDANNARYRSFLTFDLTPLHDGIVIETATLSVDQLGATGQPYGNLGAVAVNHVDFTDFSNIDGITAISLPGNLSTDANTELKSLDVSSQVQDDFMKRAIRGNDTQYRLQIDKATNDDNTEDRASFAAGSAKLEIVYVGG